MIEYIQMQHSDLILSLSIVPLPQLKGFSRYKDGSIRTCVIVQVKQHGHLPCFVIEIGRADEWSVSTLIIKPIKSENADVKLFENLTQKLLKNLVNNNGHWDREFFHHENEYTFDIAKHMSEQPSIRWAERIIEKL